MTAAADQPELFAQDTSRTVSDDSVTWLVEALRGRDWIFAGDLLAKIARPATEGNKRWIRALADASGGRVLGGQRGYKLVAEMTKDEYETSRNQWLHQRDAMQRRILEADKVFYRRTPAKR